jgi:hypothetical protein
MKNIGDKINEELNISKSFTLNMEEIDYEKLIEFLQDMQSKNSKLIQISIKGGSQRKWMGCEKSSDGNKYNCMELS